MPAPDPAAPAASTGSLVFITGCGRSGTTILGRILEQHPDVSYLNDRFDIWVEPLPVTDIWGQREKWGKAGTHEIGERPRVALTADDARQVPPEARARFAARLERARGDRAVLVEKLAINNFRLGFIRALCPEALIINIRRHGVEVARSIARKAEQGQWYGKDDRKWSLLADHAETNGYGHLLPLCTGPYENGLLEWRMSVEAAELALAEVPPGRLLRITYEQLLDDAPGTCTMLQDFIGLPRNENVAAFCTREVRRLNPAAHEVSTPPATEPIAGETLRRLGYRF